MTIINHKSACFVFICFIVDLKIALSHVSISCRRLVVGMKIYAKKHTEIWHKGAVVEIMNDDKPKPDVSTNIGLNLNTVKPQTGYPLCFSTIRVVSVLVTTYVPHKSL